MLPSSYFQSSTGNDHGILIPQRGGTGLDVVGVSGQTLISDGVSGMYWGTPSGQGVSGISGSLGISGISGNAVSGLSGISGVIATSGISGLTALSGLSGISGVTAISGLSGVSGLVALSGISGLTAISGVSGLSGRSGISGLTATSGISGLTATSGLSGISGLTALSGISGLTALSGLSGISGLSGRSGISGLTALSGISGLVGVSGISGLSGISGSAVGAGGSYVISSIFEGISRWTKTTGSGGAATAVAGGVQMDTGSTAGGYASLKLVGNGGWYVTYPANLNFGVTTDMIFHGTDYQVFLGISTGFVISGAGITYTARQIGYKFVRVASGTETRSATNGDGTSETATSFTDGAFGYGTRYNFVKTGSTNIKYYVNSTLVATHTTNIPVLENGSPDQLFALGLSNTNVATQTIIVPEHISLTVDITA